MAENNRAFDESMVKSISDSFIRNLSERLSLVFTSQPGFNIMKVPSDRDHPISFTQIYTNSGWDFRGNYETSIVKINRIFFRAQRKMKDFISFNQRDWDRFIFNSSETISGNIRKTLSNFKKTLAPYPCNNLNFHLIVPDNNLRIYADKDIFNYFFDIELTFGAYAEVDGNIIPLDLDTIGLEPENVTLYDNNSIRKIFDFVNSGRLYTFSMSFDLGEDLSKHIKRCTDNIFDFCV